jgi:hypothetical protein
MSTDLSSAGRLNSRVLSGSQTESQKIMGQESTELRFVRMASALMKCALKRDGVEKRSLRANDFEPPAAPILSFTANFYLQLRDSLERLDLGVIEVRHLYSDFIQDLFLVAEEMKVAAHGNTFPDRRNDI